MRLYDFLLSLLANLGWGFNFIAGKIGADTFQPLFFTSLRFFFLLLVMLPWLKPAHGQMKPLLRVAFTLGVIHFSMMFMGLHNGGNIASIAIATQLYVPFSALLAIIFLGERITAVRVLAIAVSLVGVMVIGFDPVVFNHIDALLWVTGGSFAMACATIMMRKCPDLGVFKLQAWIALVATPSLLLLSLIFEVDHLVILKKSELVDFWTPLYSAIGASVVGHGIVYYLLGRYPVSIVTPLTLLAPVLASIFGVLIFKDQIGWKLVAGGTMILVGILLATINPAQIQSSLAARRKKWLSIS